MTSSTNLTGSIRDSILAQKDQITQIIGEITPESIDNLEEEIGGVAATVKSYHFEGGIDNGHLAAIIPQADYRIIIEDEDWEYEPPEELDEYDEDAVTATVAQRAVIEAQHRRKYESLLTFCGVSVGAKELIIYAVGEEAVIALKARFIKYAKITPQQMIKHLRDKTCIKMTTLEKDRFKRQGYEAQWDVTKNIELYWKALDQHTIRLASRGITTSEDEKVTAAVARMWESGFFTEEKLIEWEKKDGDDQTWAAVQTYFGGLYHDHKQYSKATAKRARMSEGMNNIEEAAKEQAAEKDDASMMFAMMQEQHSEQMNIMRVQNEAAMAQNKAALAMAQTQMEKMAMLMAAMSDSVDADKENAAPNPRKRKKIKKEPGVTGLGPKLPMFSWADRKVCKNCNQLVCHFAKDCHELEANASRRPPNWTSRK